MAITKVAITTPQEREAFRSFAMIYPHEAAECNWTEFVLMNKELNPEITEEAIMEILWRT